MNTFLLERAEKFALSMEIFQLWNTTCHAMQRMFWRSLALSSSKKKHKSRNRTANNAYKYKNANLREFSMQFAYILQNMLVLKMCKWLAKKNNKNDKKKVWSQREIGGTMHNVSIPKKKQILKFQAQNSAAAKKKHRKSNHTNFP